MTAPSRLAETGRALVSHRDVERVVDDLLTAAREVTGAAYGALGVIDPGHTGPDRWLFQGIDAEGQDRIGALPHGHGVLGVLIDDPRPLRVSELGAHPRSCGFPAGHPAMRTFLGAPIVVGGTAWGALYLTEKAGGEPFTEADEEAVATLTAWAGVALENARLYTEAQERGVQLELAVRRLEATSAVARAVGTETDLRHVLELIVERARALVHARALVLLLTDGDDLLVAAGAGQVDARSLGARVPRAGSAVGEALDAGRAEALDDAPSRLSPDEDALGVVGPETAILVPLRYRGSALGVLAGFDHLGTEPAFAPADVELLEAFAASAATAVSTAQTVERERLRHSVDAAERERRRWARQLHDDTLQGLGAIRLLLSSGLRSGDGRALESAAREAAEQVAAEIGRLRGLIAELRPAALDQLGLGPALRTLVAATADLHAIDARASVDDDGPDRLPDQLETAVYRIVQEALANAVRHAGARRVDVRLRRSPEAVIVTVSDDGDGFDPASPLPGFGLAGMLERAMLVGGKLDVTSGEDGTMITASFALGQRSTSPLSSA